MAERLSNSTPSSDEVGSNRAQKASVLIFCFLFALLFFFDVFFFCVRQKSLHLIFKKFRTVSSVKT